jgi:hypothetical protein
MQLFHVFARMKEREDNSNEQHVMSSQELRSALMLTVEF